MSESLVGHSLTCAETGKQFIGATEGFTTNYARDSAGRVYCDAGVDAREKRELLDRSKPFTCYISSDGKHATGWKGNILGKVISSSPIKLTRWSCFHGKYIQAYRIRDIHGGVWYGRGNPGMCINLRATKNAAG